MARQAYGSPLSLALRAAVSPAALVVAVATVGAAFISPWLVLPGAVLYAALVYALGPARRRPRRRARLDPSGLPPTIQRDLLAVRESLTALREAALSAGRDQRPLFEGLLTEADELEGAVDRLAAQAARLHHYLSATEEATLTSRARQLEADLARTEDAQSRGDLEQALAASRAQLAQRAELRKVLDRYYATMRNLQASASGLHTTIIRLAAGEIVASETGEQPIPELSELRGTVAALEEVMQHAID